MVGMTRSLAREVGSRGITVNAVCPGFVDTRMTEGASDELRAKYIEMTPIGRFGTPEEVAAVIAFLAGPEASYVSGAVIAVDGGLSA
jgi:NAD(P)-dependent dehydrogenase (short-subunit alcohol dehydrogenase family)